MLTGICDSGKEEEDPLSVQITSSVMQQRWRRESEKELVAFPASAASFSPTFPPFIHDSIHFLFHEAYDQVLCTACYEARHLDPSRHMGAFSC